jgi:DNA-binding CsgD family transcriptional regulator
MVTRQSATPGGELSPTQVRVLALLADGHTQAAIARKLGLQPSTVKDHTIRIFTKIDASNTVHAVAIGLRTGLIR